MIIRWFGQTAIQIKSKNKITVIDPLSSKSGLTPPKLRADIVAISSRNNDQIDKNTVKPRKESNLFTIDAPGEYEIGGVMIKGIGFKNKITAYTVYQEDISVAHLGTINQKDLTEKQVEELNNVDILFIPVGNKNSIGSDAAANISQQIEPKIVVPIYYSIKGLKLKLDPIEKFLKNEGVKNAEPQEELDISSSKLPGAEETEIVVLKAQKNS
jgi:L-ascorbate metabolism protein UlaG (beta-lactamase superfamily)